MKKIAIALLAALVFVCGMCLVACSSVLDVYIFDKADSVVSGEFELPRIISEEAATWTSSNEAIIKITDRTAEDKDFLATVTPPADERTEVKLTVKVGNAKKTYSVYVEPIDVYDFSAAFKFSKDKATVTENFALPAQYEINGKTATITWSVADEYSQYIKVQNGNCVVTPSSLDPEVRIKATFSYGGETTTKSYRFTVSILKTHLETVDYWYNNTGVSVEMKGYIVAIGTAYSSSYNNVTLYMVDEDGCCGYYLYRVALKNKDDADKLKVGAYVTVTNTTNTNYSGLIETNAGGTMTFDETKNKTAAEMKAMCYALDNDVLGKVPSAIFHTSQYVSFENWKVKSVADSVTAVDNKDLFVITKNGIDITVRTSKYLEGVYKDKDSDVFKGIVGMQGKVAVGSIVSIKGILGNYNGYTLLPIDGADLTVHADATEDSSDTIKAMPGVLAGNFITTIANTVKSESLNLIITKGKEVQLPAATGAVTVQYSIIGSSSIIKVEGTKLTIGTIPSGQHERVHLQAVVTSGTYSTTYFQYIEIWGKSNAEMVEDEARELYIDDVKYPGTVDLSLIGAIYGPNVSVVWSLAEASDYASIETTYQKWGDETSPITKQVLVVGANTASDYTIKLKATLTAGEGNELATKEQQVTVSVDKFSPGSKVEDKDGKQILTVATKQDFFAYAAGWSTSYQSKNITHESVFMTGTKFSLNISNADRQTGTITDMPNMAAKSSAPVYVTLSVEGHTISAVTFQLKEWSSSKLFTDVYVEYTTDGTTWTAVEKVGWQGKTDGERIGEKGLTVEASTIPAGATQVRLVIKTAASGNTQVGLESVQATIEAAK